MLPVACTRANYSTFSANEKLGTANENSEIPKLALACEVGTEPYVGL